MKTHKAILIFLSILLAQQLICMEQSNLTAIDTRLLLATQRMGFSDHVVALAKTNNPSAQDPVGKTRLHYALQILDLQIIQLLLEEPTKKPLANVQDFDGETPLHGFFSYTPLEEYDAAQALKACSMLLASGADTALTNKKGETALHYAIKCQSDNTSFCETRPELITMLIKHGTQINAINHEGENALHYIFMNHRFGCFANTRLALLPVLLTHGALPNTQNSIGETPLHYAVMHREYNDKFYAHRQACIKQLCTGGANINSLTDNNETPLHYVVKSHDPKEDSDTTALRLDFAQVLLDLGADPNAQNKLGVTPLCILISSRHMETRHAIASLILEKYNGNPNVRTKEGFTCLHTAVNTEQAEWVKLLLAHKVTDASIVHQPTLARVPVLQQNGRTALEMALDIQKFQPAELITEPRRDGRQASTVRFVPFTKDTNSSIDQIVVLLKKHQESTLEN